jgi:hypothetical protein
VKRTFELLQELPDIVVAEARPQAEITRLDTERPFGGGLGGRAQGTSKVLIYQLLEWTPGTPGFTSELGDNILIEGQGGAHIVMLSD